MDLLSTWLFLTQTFTLFNNNSLKTPKSHNSSEINLCKEDNPWRIIYPPTIFRRRILCRRMDPWNKWMKVICNNRIWLVVHKPYDRWFMLQFFQEAMISLDRIPSSPLCKICSLNNCANDQLLTSYLRIWGINIIIAKSISIRIHIALISPTWRLQLWKRIKITLTTITCILWQEMEWLNLKRIQSRRILSSEGKKWLKYKKAIARSLSKSGPPTLSCHKSTRLFLEFTANLSTKMVLEFVSLFKMSFFCFCVR